MIKVPEAKNYEEQYNNCMYMKKKCFMLIIILNFTFSFLYLFISPGSLPLYKCFPYILFYSIAVFGLYHMKHIKYYILHKVNHLYY